MLPGCVKNGVRKAKAQLELDLARSVKKNKTSSGTSTGKKKA